MNDDKTLKLLFEECQKRNWIPEHKCKDNLKILELTHSLNSLHNIIIARKTRCEICGKEFYEEDEGGL